MPPRHAFTLVELLVVVAIIAVLAGMLLPAIVHVQRLARSTACQSHLRQVGMAFLTYADDQNDLIPTLRRVGGGLWPGLLATYLGVSNPNSTAAIGSRSVFWGCPAYLRSRERAASVTPEVNAWDTGYGMSIYPRRGTNAALYWVRNAYWTNHANEIGPQPIRLSAVTHTSQRIAIADSPFYWSWPSNVLTYHDADADPRRRHRTTANALFFDGHVAACVPDALVAGHETPHLSP